MAVKRLRQRHREPERARWRTRRPACATRRHRSLPTDHDERPGDIVQAVAAFIARCDSVRVLKYPAFVGQPQNVLERRFRQHHATLVTAEVISVSASSRKRAATEDHRSSGAARPDRSAIDSARPGSTNTRRNA